MGGYGIGLGGQDSGYGAPDMDPMGRRRGLFAALLGAQQQPTPLSGAGPGGNERTIGAEMPNRIQDDRLSRNSAWGESQAATPVGTMAGSRGDDTHLRELQGQYEDVGQQIAQPPTRLPLWRRILGGALAGPATGGILAQRQQGQEFQQNQLRQRQNTLLQQIEAERRLQEEERGQDVRADIEQNRLREQDRRFDLAEQNRRADELTRETERRQDQATAETNRRTDAATAEQNRQQDAKDRQAFEERMKKFEIANRPEQGTWQMDEDAEGKPVMFNTKTGETRAAPPGLAKPGTYQKTKGAALDAQSYADTYMRSKQFSGPGDEAMMEKYFELAKPTSGFRMTQNQMDMLLGARKLMGSLQGRARHLTKGTYFSDEQRQQIYDTMTMIIRSKQGGAGGGAGTQGVQGGPGPGVTHVWTPDKGIVPVGQGQP